MSDEQPPDPLGAFEQMVRGLGETARVLGAYFTALTEQGFSADQALQLTVAFQELVVTMWNSQ